MGFRISFKIPSNFQKGNRLFKKEERSSNFGSQQYETKGGIQFSLSNGKGGGNGYSPNADVGENLDDFMPTASIAKAMVNPLNSIHATFQFGIDAIDAGLSLKDAYIRKENTLQ